MRLAPLALLLATACSDKGSDDDTSDDDGGATAADGGAPGDGGSTGDGGGSSSCSSPTPRTEPLVSITTQAEVTAFCDSWNSVDGDLFVDVGGTDDPITELDGLDCLCEVTGDLTLTGDPDAAPPPPHVTGDIELPVLQRVGGDLAITAHPNITYLVGMESLEEIGGDLLIGANPELQVIGFYDLLRVGGTVRITDAEKLIILRLPTATSLGGIELGEAGDNVTLYYLAEFLLDELVEVTGDLRITGARNLTNLAAPKLTTIGGALAMQATCRTELEFDILADLGSLDLQGNCRLQDLAGLAAVQRVNSQDTDGASIHIEANDNLDSDEIDAWLAGLESTGTGTTSVSTDTSCLDIMAAYGDGYCD